MKDDCRSRGTERRQMLEMKSRSRTVENIWWVLKFVACYWVVHELLLLAALSAGIYPEPSTPAPSHARSVLAGFGGRALHVLIWPATYFRVVGLPGSVLAFTLPVFYGVIGLVVRNSYRHIIKTRG